MPEIVPPNPDLLAITRLYLERYPTLDPEDRVLYRQIIKMIASPPFFVHSNQAETSDLEPTDKECADGNMECLLHLVDMVEQNDLVAAKDYAAYVRVMLKLNKHLAVSKFSKRIFEKNLKDGAYWAPGGLQPGESQESYYKRATRLETRPRPTRKNPND